jgi:hypothetical protein
MAIWYIYGHFGIFVGYLVYFFPFWYVVARKIWQPWFPEAPTHFEVPRHHCFPNARKKILF